MNWTWQRRWNLMKEIEFLLIAAQNNAIRTDYIKAKRYNTQNSKFRLCGVRDETVNHINESSVAERTSYFLFGA